MLYRVFRLLDLGLSLYLRVDYYFLRDEPINPEEEVLEQFHATKNPKEKINLGENLYKLSENISIIRDELPEILSDLTDAIKNAKSLSQADRLPWGLGSQQLSA